MPSEKTLKRIVIILGVLLVLGFTVVVGTIVYRAANLASRDDVAAQETPGTLSATLPDGAKIIGGSRTGDTLTLHYETIDGTEKVIVWNIQTGEVLSELELRNENQ